MPRSNRQHGFTLLEIIVAFSLLSILVSVAGFFLVTGIQGYVMARDNADVAQKANLALTRISKELMGEMEDIVSLQGSAGSATGVRYLFEAVGNQRRNLLLVGDSLMLNTGSSDPDANSDEVLVDDVSNFSMNFQRYNGNAWSTAAGMSELYRVVITLTLDVSPATSDTVTFTTTVNPRNNDTLNGPYQSSS